MSMNFLKKKEGKKVSCEATRLAAAVSLLIHCGSWASDWPIPFFAVFFYFLSQHNLSVVQDPGVFFHESMVFIAPLMINYDFTTLLFKLCDVP